LGPQSCSPGRGPVGTGVGLGVGPGFCPALEAGWGDGPRAAVWAGVGVRPGVGVEACAAGADGSGFVDAVTAVGPETLPEELVPVTTDGDTDEQDEGAVAVGEAVCTHAGPPPMEGVA
jgi:hypothetical protein